MYVEENTIRWYSTFLNETFLFFCTLDWCDFIVQNFNDFKIM